MKTRSYRYFVGDFETTVYENQQNTEVWASACVELFSEEVHIFHSIDEQNDYFISLNEHIICYYHNLKFDGAFWISFLLNRLGYTQAYTCGENNVDFRWQTLKEMKNNTFIYSISNMGQWYRIIIKQNNKILELRDSLKLLPFSVAKIGKSFDTKHKKLDMVYEGFRYAGCPITEEEQRYIANDVLVIKEAVEIMFLEGHKKLTIGSCCLHEYKQLIGYKAYQAYFPNLYDIKLDKNIYGSETAGDWLRLSYRGGWCYLVKGKENKIFRNGLTADVNSLYPSMMSSESGNRYPVGEPIFWHGNYIPKEATLPTNFFFIKIRTRFRIKEGMLPFIQIKNTLKYKFNEMLETSDIYDTETGLYSEEYYDFDGTVKKATVTLTLTMMDFKLMLKHYYLTDVEILDGCYFKSAIGIFDCYIEKYKKIKLESKGAKRELAKLFLNNLYGKMASSKNSSFKVAYVKEDRSIGFTTIEANDKEPGYIAVGSAITSYARCFTINAAQANYHGVDQPGFIYADTDSIHCDLSPDEVQGLTVHPKNFCCWKLESNWDIALFVRQKTYIEHVVKEDSVPVDEPYYSVKCAGMPEKCKDLFIKNITGYDPENDDSFNAKEKEFIRKRIKLTDFKVGLVIPGKLIPKQIPGGVVLKDTTYEMR